MKSFTLSLLSLALFALSVHAQEATLTTTGCVVVGSGSTVSCQPQPTAPVRCVAPGAPPGGTASGTVSCTTLTDIPTAPVPTPTICSAFLSDGSVISQNCGPGVGGTSTSIGTETRVTVPVGGTPVPAIGTPPPANGTNTGSTSGPNTGIPLPTGAAERLGANKWIATGMVLAGMLF